MNKNTEDNNNAKWSQNGDRNVHAFEFIGAVLIYFFKFGKTDSNEIAKPKNAKRNLLVGNIFCAILFILMLVLITTL